MIDWLGIRIFCEYRTVIPTVKSQWDYDIPNEDILWSSWKWGTEGNGEEVGQKVVTYVKYLAIQTCSRNIAKVIFIPQTMNGGPSPGWYWVYRPFLMHGQNYLTPMHLRNTMTRTEKSRLTSNACEWHECRTNYQHHIMSVNLG